MAWSTTEGKTKAIKAAERSHKGEPLTTYEEREAERQERFADEPKTQKDQAAPDRLPDVLDALTADLDEPETVQRPDPIPQPMKVAAALLKSVSLPRSAPASLSIPCQCSEDSPAQAGVSFTITGTLNMETTDSLNTIRAAVELLREHGLVECDAIVPNRVKL